MCAIHAHSCVKEQVSRNDECTDIAVILTFVCLAAFMLFLWLRCATQFFRQQITCDFFNIIICLLSAALRTPDCSVLRIYAICVLRRCWKLPEASYVAAY